MKRVAKAMLTLIKSATASAIYLWACFRFYSQLLECKVVLHVYSFTPPLPIAPMSSMHTCTYTYTYMSMNTLYLIRGRFL